MDIGRRALPEVREVVQTFQDSEPALCPEKWDHVFRFARIPPPPGNHANDEAAKPNLPSPIGTVRMGVAGSHFEIGISLLLYLPPFTMRLRALVVELSAEPARTPLLRCPTWPARAQACQETGHGSGAHVTCAGFCSVLFPLQLNALEPLRAPKAAQRLPKPHNRAQLHKQCCQEIRNPQAGATSGVEGIMGAPRPRTARPAPPSTTCGRANAQPH